VVDRHAGDKRPNPPRFLEKSDQAVHHFRAVRKRTPHETGGRAAALCTVEG